MRFLGNIEAKTDAKGRAFMPAIFRKELQVSCEEKLVMRKDIFQPCLVIYPESIWNGQLDMLRSKLNRWDMKQWQLFRQFVSDVEVLTLDGNGRFLIPKRYISMIGLSQNIKFIGMDDTVEIWNNTKEPFMQPEEFGKALQKIMTAENDED
jgi:MraZ protein